MRDERDEPRTDTDVNGDSYYITEDGCRIPIKDLSSAESLKSLEEKMRYEMQFPMGMK